MAPVQSLEVTFDLGGSLETSQATYPHHWPKNTPSWPRLGLESGQPWTMLPAPWPISLPAFSSFLQGESPAPSINFWLIKT